MRQDDTEKKSFFRSADRVFHMNGAWYFSTREGEEGPYASEVQAQLEIKRFILEKTELAQFQKAREKQRCHSALRVKSDKDEVEDEDLIDLIPSRDWPRRRPQQRVLSKRKVHI